MSLEEELFSFLKSDEKEKRFDINEYKNMIIVKIPYNDKLDILYGNDKRDLFDLHSNLDYYGLYDKENNQIYDVNYNLRYDILKYEFDDPRCVYKETLHNEISNEVNDRIKELIDDDPEMFDYSQVEVEEEYLDVYNEFMKGITSDNYENEITKYVSNRSQNILDYLTDKDSFIETESREFIVDHTEDILKCLKNSEIRRKKLKELEEDKTNPLYKERDVLTAITNKDYKSVNIFINKDGIEQNFKYDTRNIGIWHNKYLYGHYIIKLDDRNKFYDTFGRSADINFEDIVKITYGKNVIYEDKDKVKEEEYAIS